MDNTRSIKEAITRRYPEVGLDDTLETAIREMASNNTSALVVISGGELVGLVTISDVMFSLAHDRDPGDTKNSSFMTKCDLIHREGTRNPCAQLDEDQDAISAIKVMFAAGVNHLVVSGGKGKPIGVVSSLELVKLLGT